MLVSLVLPPGAGRLGDWEALTKELQGKYAPAAQKSAEAGAPSSAPPTSAPGAAVPVGAPMDRTLQRGAAKGGSPARNLDLDGTPAPAGAEPAREGASEAFQVRSRSSAPRPAPRLEAREAAPRSDPGLAFRAVEGTSEIVIDLEPEALDSLRAYLRSWVAARDGDLQVSEVFAEDVAKAKESVEKGAADGSPLRDALAVGGGAEPAAEEGVPAPAAEMEPEAAGAESGAGVEGEEIEVAAPPDREAADILVPAAGAAGFAPAETKSEAPRRLRVRVRLGSMPPVQR